MYQIETDKEGNQIIKATLEDNTCSHDFYKAGAWIKCRKCTAEWFDPDNKFNLLCKKNLKLKKK